MKIKSLACFFVLLCLIVCLSAEENDTTIEVGDIIDSGYLFYDGKYIESPYTFTRKGLSVFVNKNKIFYPEQVIKHLLRNRDNNVDISAIGKEITFEEFLDPDKPWWSYVSREVEHINNLYPKNARQHIIDLYKTLPFVKKAIPHPRGGIIVETHKGETINIDTESIIAPKNQSKKKIPTKDDVAQMLEKQCAESIQEELRKGSCVFVFSDIQKRLILGTTDIQNNLPEILNTITSKKSKNIKINQLYRLRVFPQRKFIKSEILIDNFEKNEQLQAKIDEILKWRKTTGHKREKVELLPTPEEQVNAHINADKVTEAEYKKKHPEKYKNKQLYLKKFLEFRKKEKEGYWKTHKEELKEAIEELKKLK